MTITSFSPGRITLATMILAAAVACSGCGGSDKTDQAGESQDTATETVTLTAEQEALVLQAAAIADAIAGAPETMAEVLAENSLTADEYEAIIYRISADPLLAKAYEDARNN